MQATSNKIKKITSGFTIVELIVVITVMGILLVLVMDILTDLYSSNAITLGRSVQDTDTRSVLRSIESDLSDATSWTTNLAPQVQPLGPTVTPSDPWVYCGNAGNSACSNPNANRVLIAYTYATDKAPSDPSRLPVFAQTAGNCDAGSASPMLVANIYFVAQDPQNSAKSNLYRRTIYNPGNSTPCSATHYQKTTCKAADAGNVAYASICQGVDATLLQDITSMKVDYYTSSSDTSPIANQYSGYPSDTNLTTLISQAKTVKITVKTNRVINGIKQEQNADIRISRPF